MNFPEILLRIIEENNCPMYDLDDEFDLSGSALVSPPEKPVCMILVRDITEFFQARDKSQPKGVLPCSGCSGKIRLAYRLDLSYTLPPPRKSEAELAVIAGRLRRFSIFRMLDQDDVKEIVALLKLKKYEAGEIVIRSGDPGRQLYIIVAGKVAVLGEDDIRIDVIGAGEVFGEMSLISGGPAGASIKVMEPSRILSINSRAFRKIMNRHPSLQIYFARLLADRLAVTNRARVEELSSGMIGRLSEMPPAELFQTLYNNQKTGVLILDLSKGGAEVAFGQGQIVQATYDGKEGVAAFFDILRERQGRFRFRPGLDTETAQAAPLGDFMWLLMEGVNRIDEEGQGEG